MSQASGQAAQVQLDFETAYKTPPVSPAAILMPIISCDIAASRPRNASGVIRNNRSPAPPFNGRLDVSGNVVVPVDEVAFGYWLKAMFGAPTTTGAEAPYTHVFKLTGAQPSLVIDKGFADLGKYFLYKGVKISTCSIQVGGDGELQASMGIMGASETPGTSAYMASPTEPAFSRFEHAHATIQEGGSDFDAGTEFKFDLNFGLDGNSYGINDGGERSGLTTGVAQVNGTLKGIFDASAYALISKAIADTESSLKITFAKGTHSLEFSYPEVLFARKSPPISGPTGVFLDAGWQAYYDNNADASAVKVTLINGQASYA